MNWLLWTVRCGLVAMDGCYGLIAIEGCYVLVAMEGCYGLVAMDWLVCMAATC